MCCINNVKIQLMHVNIVDFSILPFINIPSYNLKLLISYLKFIINR